MKWDLFLHSVGALMVVLFIVGLALVVEREVSGRGGFSLIHWKAPPIKTNLPTWDKFAHQQITRFNDGSY